MSSYFCETWKNVLCRENWKQPHPRRLQRHSGSHVFRPRCRPRPRCLKVPCPCITVDPVTLLISDSEIESDQDDDDPVSITVPPGSPLKLLCSKRYR